VGVVLSFGVDLIPVLNLDAALGAVWEDISCCWRAELGADLNGPDGGGNQHLSRSTFVAADRSPVPILPAVV
jgi:hypothetical protein